MYDDVLNGNTAWHLICDVLRCRRKTVDSHRQGPGCGQWPLAVLWLRWYVARLFYYCRTILLLQNYFTTTDRKLGAASGYRKHISHDCVRMHWGVGILHLYAHTAATNTHDFLTHELSACVLHRVSMCRHFVPVNLSIDMEPLITFFCVPPPPSPYPYPFSYSSPSLSLALSLYRSLPSLSLSLSLSYLYPYLIPISIPPPTFPPFLLLSSSSSPPPPLLLLLSSPPPSPRVLLLFTPLEQASFLR